MRPTHADIYIYTLVVILCYLSVTGRLIAKVSIADLNNKSISAVPSHHQQPKSESITFITLSIF